MGRIISIGYKGNLTSSDLNNNFHGLIGENIVVDGFNPISGSVYNKLSLSVTGSEPSKLRIKGTEIQETESLIDIITLPTTNSGVTSLLTYDLVCIYDHMAGSVSYTARPHSETLDIEKECVIGTVTFPGNYTSSSQVIIKKRLELATLSDLKTLPHGSPGEKFQIDHEEGPILKYVESGGDGTKLHLRNSVDSSYADFIVRNLTVLGETQSASQKTLDTTGEWVLINTDLASNAEPSQDAGIEINRGIQPNARIMWDELNNKWKAGLKNLEQELILGNNPKLTHLNSDGTFPFTNLTGVPEFLPKNQSHNKNEDKMLKGIGVIVEAGDVTDLLSFKINNDVKVKIYENPLSIGKYLFSGQILSSNVFGLSDFIKNWLLSPTPLQLGNITAGATIAQFLSCGDIKSYIDSTGKYMGDADSVDGFHHDQSLLTSATPKFKTVSAELNADNKTIMSSAATGGQILVKSKVANQLDFGFFMNESTPVLVASIKSDGRFSTKGDITSEGRIFNAVYNDYAEFFEKNPGSKIMPGEVVGKVRMKNAYDTYNPETCSFPVGIYSDNFGHVIGGTEENIEDNLECFIPVALKGRVHVKCFGHIEEGQYLIPSSHPGCAIGTWDKTEDHILGIALESTGFEENPGYILTLVR